MEVQFVIPGGAVPKARARISTRGGFGRAYTPAKTVNYENLVKMAADAERVRVGMTTPYEGAVTATVLVYRDIPKSLSKSKRLLAISGHLRPTTKPDIDNVVKTIFDALNGIIWKDDTQVVKVTAEKFYSETPRVEVVVRHI